MNGSRHVAGVSHGLWGIAAAALFPQNNNEVAAQMLGQCGLSREGQREDQSGPVSASRNSKVKKPRLRSSQRVTLEETQT